MGMYGNGRADRGRESKMCAGVGPPKKQPLTFSEYDVLAKKVM